jgi:single-stranded DNA-binding protein
MIFALIQGILHGAPQGKTSKNGPAYVSATFKALDGDAIQWVRVTVFSETAQAELLRLDDGDAVAVQGPLKAETYERDAGEKRLSLSIVADQALALRRPPRNRETKPAMQPGPQSRQERLRGSWTPGAGPNDSLDGLGF